MNDPFAVRFAISSDDSSAFAELSGDHNPLHVDPVAARRTQFGDTVVHGIHAVLKALDATASSWNTAGREPVALSATFSNPIRSGATIHVGCGGGTDGERIRLVAESNGKPAFTLNLRLGAAVTARITDDAPANGVHSITPPVDLPFPPGVLEGEVPLMADPALVARLFPNLASRANLRWITDLLASTRIVGMECPGLNSIFAGLKLTRKDEMRPATPPTMSYKVDKIDPRFRLAQLKVSGGHFAGTLDTFFRPPAVTQRTLSDISESVHPRLFAGQRALVVGGSRGLGEVVAKILIAGGADVTITYSRGRSDAERVVSEASAIGRDGECLLLDVNALDGTASLEWLTDVPFTHCYYFASPHIEKNVTGRWNRGIFDRFAAVYVHGLALLVDHLNSARRPGAPAPSLFYPSTIFIEDHEPGFAEYCAAKLAGEGLSRHIARARGMTVATPRLPRMRTDQTSAVIDVGAGDPLPILLALLKDFSGCQR